MRVSVIWEMLFFPLQHLLDWQAWDLNLHIFSFHVHGWSWAFLSKATLDVQSA